MLIESVPGEPLSFHVIPFDNPRQQYTLEVCGCPIQSNPIQSRSHLSFFIVVLFSLSLSCFTFCFLCLINDHPTKYANGLN